MSAQSPTRYPKDLTWAEMNNGRRDPLQPEDDVLLWTRPPNHNKYPWTTWSAFKTEMHEFFMSTETKQHATDDLMKLEQRNTPIEDYIIKFNALSPLVGWGEAALKDHFLNRINPALGGELIRHGNLADDATLKQIQDRAVQLARVYRRAKEAYGDKKSRNEYQRGADC